MLEINKIYNMDCMKGMEQIDSHSVDLVVTDPPYEVDYSNKSKALSKLGKSRTKQIKRDKNFVEFKNFNYTRFCFELKRIVKSDAHIYIFCVGDDIYKWYKYMIYAGFNYMDLLFWLKEKQTFDLSCGYHYNYQTENCMFFTIGSRKLNKLGLSNVLKFNTPKNKYNHPTIKPLELIQFLIINSSNENDVVFDPFMGSGTTAVACKSLNRNFIGFEISEYFYNICKDRLKTNILNF